MTAAAMLSGKVHSTDRGGSTAGQLDTQAPGRKSDMAAFRVIWI
jgi:hypothetical protein